MQIASDVLQLSLALLFIFGGLVCLNLSIRISRKLTDLPVIFPDDEKHQEKVKQREKAARRVVMEWGILVILEIILSSIGGYLAIGFFGVLFFLTIILVSHYINRGRIPHTDYDPLVMLSNRIVLTDVYGNTTSTYAKSAILSFIQQYNLTKMEATGLLDHLVKSKMITNDIKTEIENTL